jgi:hypothetical protein
MVTAIRWTLLPAAPGATSLASRMRQKGRDDRKACKPELNEWENEGGTIAPPAGPPSGLETTRLA